MTDAELCKWLRENSSGAYRPAREAADRIEELLGLLGAIANGKPVSKIARPRSELVKIRGAARAALAP